MSCELEDLGYGEFFASSRQGLGLDGYAVARVIAEHRGAYKVKNPAGVYLAEVTGRHMFTAQSREDYPAVGDWVAITEMDAESAIINGVLRRKTILQRKYSGQLEAQVIATNIDVAFIVESIDRDYNLNRLERYMAIARDGGIEPVVVLNKIDLIPLEELDLKTAQVRARLGDVDFVQSSAFLAEGLDGISSRISRGNTYCFLGSSGVGKSSLINRLLGGEVIRIEDISRHTGRGRHTTTAREMYFLAGGGIVIDNPGMREIGMTGSHAGIRDVFAEVAALSHACRFKDCTHMREPGCAVREAVTNGELDEAAILNYARLKKEAEYYEMSSLEKKNKDRQFGKFVKRAKKQLKEFKEFEQ
ncbi:MAG: ribosome small subunit-dependent GTPase A [Actinobacteria bacterium]|jgi:ribosome biogenesis GTPase|nr:MAG: ribosome small subunit-dependent GTPase A [Actinomycetota bacterium]